jgi:hexosaminidase
MPASDFRLDSDWNPEARRLTLTLVNRGREPLSEFRLAFTSLLRIKGAESVEGGALVEQLSNSHVIAPPDGLVLPPGATWTVTADKVSHDLRHYTYGPKTAWLILGDGRKVVVDPTPMTRGGIAGAPSPAHAPTGPLPPGAPPIAVIPHPRSVTLEGARDLPSAIVFTAGPAEARAAHDAVAALAARLFPDAPTLFGDGGLACRAEVDAALGPEACRLHFDGDGVRVVASAAAGFRYGWITLGQILRGARLRPDTFVFPQSGVIDDAPRFAFRGAHLDVARQVYSVDEVARFIDCLAWNKLNVLHLHLSDDEGWRLDIPGYPELAAVAAWRGDGLAVPPLLGSGLARYGGFYSADNIRQLVAHAGALGVAIAPEIDIPGHCHCVLEAIPSLRDADETGVYRSIQGFPNNALNPAVEKTYAFLEAVFAEIAGLFPAPWIHVGGDEVAPGAWLGSPLARALMAEHGWTESDQLQSHFLKRVQGILRGLGKETGAWEEASLGGGVGAEGSYLVAWRKSASGLALAEAGYNVVLAPAEHAYFDMAQSDEFWEPGASWAGNVPLAASYAFDPGGDWPEATRSKLIGVQSCLWSENLHDKALFDHLVFPRLSAIAETAWTPAGNKSWPRFIATHPLMPVSGMGAPEPLDR